jgi:pyruvate/2-oxoglutarate dehydrogenase complex dihydrolipoamide dehydrogenase (E3) component
MPVENYTNVIIGSGEGGKYLAWHLGSSGQKTAVVERRWIGGSCPNINCLPSKNEVWSAKVAQLVRRGERFGVKPDPGPSNLAAVTKRKREMVAGLVAKHLELYKASGAELIMGQAHFTGPKTVEVKLNDGESRTLAGERLFLNLGTHAFIPPSPGLAESMPLTNIELLELDRLPEHLIVVGSGYVGLEFAQAYRRFGSRVTVLEQSSQLLSNADPDVAAEMERILTAEGIELISPAKIVGVHGRSGSGVTIELQTPSGDKQISGSDILVAAGRVPNTAGIGLESIGVELDSKGFIKVNDRLETTAPNIWAIGEGAGSAQFTHVSFDDFRVIRDNLAGKNRSTRGRVVPSCLFTDPQLAHIGLTEKDASRQGIVVEVVKMPMRSVLRAITIDETSGFMKALVDLRNGLVRGFTMIGPEAGEVVAVVQMAMLCGRPYTTLRDAIITHPTMAEALGALFSNVKQAKIEEGTEPDSRGSRDLQPSAA